MENISPRISLDLRGFINSSRLSQRTEHLFPQRVARSLRLSHAAHPDQLPRKLRALNEARNNSPRLPPFFNRHTSTLTTTRASCTLLATRAVSRIEQHAVGRLERSSDAMEEGRMRLPRCVSFQSKLIAVETITLERPPDHSITTLYRHRPRPSVITVWQPDGKRPGPASPIKLYRVVCVYVYIFSLVIHPFSLSLLSRFSFASFSISSGAG